VELNDGNLVVSRGKDVCIMTSQGQVIQSIAGSRETVAPFKNTRCLAVDRQGYILVVDEGTNRVLVVDPSLSDSRVLQLPMSNSTNSTDFIRKPLAICWDHSRGRIFVGESEASVNDNRVLVFDNVVNLDFLFM
jgi:DNA-binding beta-propeller fold protein YncE